MITALNYTIQKGSKHDNRIELHNTEGNEGKSELYLVAWDLGREESVNGGAGRACGPSAPPQGGRVGKENYVWFRRGKQMIWRVFSLFTPPRGMPRIRALSVYQRQRRSGQRINNPTTFNPEA
jgi:hypothetical protein